MLKDILEFAVRTLVVRGRLAMWIPSASDEDPKLPIPMHPQLEVVSISLQEFSHCKSFIAFPMAY
jgi:tRNA (guanine10-N2)-methyltransferase